MIKLRLTALFFLLVLGSDLLAIVPERRRLFEERNPNTYMVLPLIASLPGVGVFGGILGSFSNIADSGVDLAVTEANTISGDSDIHLRAYAFREVPLIIPGLTVEYWFGDIKFDDFYSYLPGRDSPDFQIPSTGEFDYYFLRPAYRLWDRRINLTYNLIFFKGYGLGSGGEETQVAGHAASGGIQFDFTDDWVDPRKGLRLGYGFSMTAPTKSVLGEDSATEEEAYDSDIKTKTYQIGLYSPFGEQATLALYNERFLATGGEEGQVVSGGALPLRGYPGGRWSDRYGDTKIAEFRYNIPMNWDMDWVLVHGMLDDLQWALFYEEGQVSPENDSRLTEDLKTSQGFGFRALIDAIVLRLDFAFSEAGNETHLTIDHAF